MAKKAEKPKIDKSEYRLKKMYNGLTFFGKVYRNDNIDDKAFKLLVDKHPLGLNLFEKIK